nr:retrovirus-related Pol polyprotein from transposon TNT 1-94 [Tanacetum cinerariifolium]
MEDVLQSPTDNVGDAIVAPPILANQFKLKIRLLNLVTAISFNNFANDDPHSQIRRLEAYEGEINLGVEENMISSEYAVKLCLEYEVKRVNNVVKKELIVSLRGKIYFVKFIINPKDNDVEPGVIFERSFLRMTKAITDFEAGTDHSLDFNLHNVPLLGGEELSLFVCKMKKSSRNKKRAMENLNLFYQYIGTSSSAGGHLTPKEAAKEALAKRISQKFSLLEEVRPVIEKMAYHDKYKKILDEIWKDTMKLDGKIVKEEEEAVKRIKGEALKEKDNPRAFVFPIRLEGQVNKNALADIGSDINTMPYQICKQLGREEMKKVDRGIKMINHTQEEAMGILTNVLCQIWVTTLISKFLILDIPIDRDALIVVGRGFMRDDMHYQPVAPTTAEQRLARKNELKARGTLLMALLDKYQLKFNTHKDAKTLMEAIEKRFGGNTKTKKRTHTLIWRNKTDLEEQSLDDLFNNLKIYEAEVKSSSSVSTSTQNIAFVSSSNTDSTNELVSAADSVSAIDADDLEEMDLKWQMAMKGHFARECRSSKDTKSNGAAEPQRRKEEPTNYALMAFSSLSSSSDNEPTEQVKSPRPSVQYVETSIPTVNPKTAIPKPTSNGKRKNRKACFVCKSLDHLIKDYDYHEKQKAQTNVRNHAPRGNNQHYAKMPLINPQRHIVPTTVVPKSKLVPINAARPITTAVPKFNVTRPRHDKPVVTKPNSPLRRHINCSPSLKASNFPPKVTGVQTPMVNAAKGVQGKWAWKPKCPILDHVSHNTSASMTLKMFDSNDALRRSKSDKGVIDSGCSRHMTGNMSYLLDFKELNGGHVAFGGNPKGGKISRKGKIRTSKLDFDDVYIIKELKFNLFSVSQMCDKKDNVLFTDTECLILSPEFKLPDENQVLLRVPRENNMYNVNLKNIVPSRDLTYLFTKATLDESNLWHRRLGHINFKTMNKLVKCNLVRGLPSKVFENDNTCVACKKGKEHRASCKTKPVSSVDQPLYRLHMDLFGPTFVKSLNKKSYYLVVTDDYSRFIWVFFLATKDETSPILETFITSLENQLSLKVKIIRSDNGTEFKNNDLNQFCGMKGVKREFSKFDGKVDEGFLVRYSISSKAFRVLHCRTRIVQETLHANFLENKPNVAGSGPTWLFDIDTLTKTMNYQPVTAGNQSNPSAGEPEFKGRKPESEVNLSQSSSAQSKKHVDKTNREAKGKSPVESLTGYRNLSAEFEDFSDNSYNEDNAAGTLVPAVEQLSPNITNTFSAAGPSNTAASPTQGKSSCIDTSQLPDDLSMPELEDITYSDDEDDVGAEADFNNLETSITVSPISTTRVHKYHHVTQIIEEPKRVHQALKDPSWIEAIQEELLQFKMQKVWVLVDLPHGKRAICTKWVFRNKKDDRGIVVRNKARLVTQGHTQEERIDYKEVFAPEDVYVYQPPGFEDLDHPDKIYVDDIIFGLTNKDLCKAFEKLMKEKFQMSSMGTHILFRLTDGKSASTPIDTEKPLLKDPDGKDVDVHTYRSMIGSLMYLISSRPDIMFAVYACAHFQVTTKALHLHAVKRIFRYLKGKPHLGLWYPKDLPFDLVSYSDSDYAGASLDRKSTTRGVNTPRCDEDMIELLELMVFLLPSDEKVGIEGIECLPNEEIFTELARMCYEKPSTKLTFYKTFFSSQWKFLIHTILQCMSAKRTSWNEFSSSMASAIICLSTEYSSPAMTQKVFANMRRVGKGFSRAKTPLFKGMIVEQQVNEGADEVHGEGVPAAGVVAEGVVSAADDVPTDVEEPSIPSPTPPTPPPQSSQDQPSTSQVQLTPPQSPQAQPQLPQHQPQPSQDDKIAQALEITKLKQRVKKLERRNKATKLQRLKRVGTAQIIETSDDTIMDDVSKQGRIIADKDVVLEDVKEVAVEKSADVDESANV